MIIKKLDENNYSVKNKYIVSSDLKSCTCPDFLYRQKKFGSECKHIVAVREWLQNQQEINVEDGTNALDFIENYGENVLTALKKSGEIFEKRGVLFNIK